MDKLIYLNIGGGKIYGQTDAVRTHFGAFSIGADKAAASPRPMTGACL